MPFRELSAPIADLFCFHYTCCKGQAELTPLSATSGFAARNINHCPLPYISIWLLHLLRDILVASTLGQTCGRRLVIPWPHSRILFQVPRRHLRFHSQVPLPLRQELLQIPARLQIAVGCMQYQCFRAGGGGHHHAAGTASTTSTARFLVNGHASDIAGLSPNFVQKWRFCNLFIALVRLCQQWFRFATLASRRVSSG